MKQKELTAIKQAILTEIEGYEFYKMASQNFEGTDVKEAFQSLMEEEKMHAKWLQEAYEKLEQSENTPIELAMLETAPEAKIFDWKNLMRQSAQSPLSVFGIALELEKSSMDYYSEMAKTSTNKNLKSLYELLAQWEKTHYTQFDSVYKELKEDWWSTQNYAPF